MKTLEFRFDCPHCGEPWARPKEDLVDVHGGGVILTCEDCGGKVKIDVEEYHETV